MSDITLLNTDNMPMLALRGLAVFPNMVLNFDVERRKSISAVNTAAEGDRMIFLLSQRDVVTEDPTEEDLYEIGTVCYIKQFLRVPGGGMKVLVEGRSRAKLVEIRSRVKYYSTRIELVPEKEIRTLGTRTEAMIRKSFELFDTYAAITGNVTKESVLSIMTSTDPGYIADYIAQSVYMRLDRKQKVLDTLDPEKRLKLVCDLITREIGVIQVEQEIDGKLRDRLGEQQRDNVLREQMKIIRSELGEDQDPDSETAQYRKKIAELHLPAETEEKLLKEVDKLEKQPFGSAETSVIKNFLDICISLPWNKTTKERADVAVARRMLDEDHYGLDKVKERILEFIAVKQMAPKTNPAIICLVGPPGTGKTSVAISIARALNRKLARIALGGIHDEAEIRGHRKTYVGAMPGRIISALAQAKTRNPLMLLDEIDKLGSDYRGDPSAALLEALDPEQNSTFRDNFLEVPFDLSDVMFITTANNAGTIPRPLLDRMEIIELSSYTDNEKLEIAKRHLIPKQRKKHGLSQRQLKFSDDAIREIISGYTRESGVRTLEREIAAVCRKTVAKIVEGEYKTVNIKSGMLQDYLGVRRYLPETLADADEPGLVRGLAWTSVGGSILDVEVNAVPGSGKLELTGNLGDVMKESARAAITYIRSRAEKLGIDPDFYKNTDIHIHFPEGAVPKDGPSAGITMAVAVISALTGAPVRRDVAMTGEITLRGRVLAIGGLKEKTMAAMRSGVTTVIIPAENERDLEEIDKTVRMSLNFITARKVDDILDVVMQLPKAEREESGREDPAPPVGAIAVSGEKPNIRRKVRS